MMLAILPFLISIAGWAEPPSWFTQPATVNSAAAEISCQGDGISFHLARQSALSNCISALSAQLTSEFQIEALSVQTEQSASYHETVKANMNVLGATCHPLHESHEERADGQHVHSIRCRYDLGKVTTAASRSNLKTPPAAGAKEINRDPSSFNLQVVSIPICTDILVIGRGSRTIKCDSNPTSIVISGSDTKIIVRKTGFRPRDVLLKEITEKNGTVYVHFEE